jgi:hypothetical protein
VGKPSENNSKRKPYVEAAKVSRWKGSYHLLVYGTTTPIAILVHSQELAEGNARRATFHVWAFRELRTFAANQAQSAGSARERAR